MNIVLTTLICVFSYWIFHDSVNASYRPPKLVVKIDHRNNAALYEDDVKIREITHTAFNCTQSIGSHVLYTVEARLNNRYTVLGRIEGTCLKNGSLQYLLYDASENVLFHISNLLKESIFASGSQVGELSARFYLKKKSLILVSNYVNPGTCEGNNFYIGCPLSLGNDTIKKFAIKVLKTARTGPDSLAGDSALYGRFSLTIPLASLSDYLVTY